MALGPARSLALALILLAAPAAQAVTANYLGYTSFYRLGDSLTDTRNVYRATLGREPKSPPYWRGRFSNGPVWADRVAERFKDADAPTANLAWGGAKATGGATDIGNQASRYRLIDRDRPGSRPLLSLWAGGNDIKARAGEADIERVGRRAANAMGNAIVSLSRARVRDFLVFNLPDIGKIPYFAQRSDPSRGRSATKGAEAFNDRLDERIADLRDRGLNVHLVDTYTFFNEMVADPRSVGVRDTENPCLSPSGKLCKPSQRRYRAFFDTLHPNWVVHNRIAELALAELAAAGPPIAIAAPVASSSPVSLAAAVPFAPVPLPAPAALLVGALLALGCARRRAGERSPLPWFYKRRR